MPLAALWLVNLAIWLPYRRRSPLDGLRIYGSVAVGAVFFLFLHVWAPTVIELDLKL